MKNFPTDDQSEGCQIGDEKVEVGDHVDFPNLCVRLSCKADSAVEPTSIPVFLRFKLISIDKQIEIDAVGGQKK
jgi:hypothetical protein